MNHTEKISFELVGGNILEEQKLALKLSLFLDDERTCSYSRLLCALPCKFNESKSFQNREIIKQLGN